jgi:hypothetical protein
MMATRQRKVCQRADIPFWNDFHQLGRAGAIL